MEIHRNGMSEQINYNEELNNGKYLFKYAQFNVNSLQTIINHTIYFNFPRNLNDPLDSRFDLRIINPENFSQNTKENILHSRFELSDNTKSLAKDMGVTSGRIESQERLLNSFFDNYQNTNIGVSCFSLTGDENLMWSHYAQEAKGICFVFNKEELLKSLIDSLDKTRYLFRSKELKYSGVRKLIIRLLKKGDMRYTLNHLYSKTKHWKYEKEYRIVILQKQRSMFDLSSFNFNPYLQFDKNALKYVVLGERMSKVHKTMIIRLLTGSSTKVIEHSFNS